MKARDGTRAHSSSPTCTHRIVRAELASDGGPAHVSTVLEVTDDEPSGLGWLPDGRMLVVAMETQRLLRLEPDGTLVEHADLSSLARGSLNDMIVATDGTAYVGDMGVRIQEGGEARPRPDLPRGARRRCRARPTTCSRRTATCSPTTAAH